MATMDAWLADLLNENSATNDDVHLQEIITDYFGQREDDDSSDDDRGW